MIAGVVRENHPGRRRKALPSPRMASSRNKSGAWGEIRSVGQASLPRLPEVRQAGRACGQRRFVAQPTDRISPFLGKSIGSTKKCNLFLKAPQKPPILLVS